MIIDSEIDESTADHFGLTNIHSQKFYKVMDMYRRAHFIWSPSQKIDADEVFRVLVRDGPKDRREGVNRWVFFRREVEFRARPDAAEMRITADSRYQLFVNGNRVGRGPVRSPSYVRRYDTYDISQHLQQGTNVFAVLVHVYGEDTAWYEMGPRYPRSIFGDGGLWLEADIQISDVSEVLLSDPNWRCLRSNAWVQNTPTAGWGQGRIEDIDANLLPHGWLEPGFDDSSWERAREMVWEGVEYECEMGWGPHEAFPTIEPNELPKLHESEVYGDVVRGLNSVIPDPSKDIGRRLYEEKFERIQEGMVDAPDALLSADGITTIRTGDHDVSVLIDFGPIHTGYPFIEIEAEGGEIVELAASEKIAGDFTAATIEIPRIERPTHLDCAQMFRYQARPGIQRHEKFDWTGIRYLQLIVRNAPNGLKVHKLGSIRSSYPAGERGTFECSDQRLNDLWQVGRYTALQCTSDAWCDGPGREKRQWVGDGLIHYLIDAAAFGPGTQAVDRQFFRAGAETQRPDGLIQMFTPGDHHRDGVAIADFPLHWIAACDHYLMHSGDLDFVASIYPAIQKALQWYEPHINADGLIVNPPLWRFIEWAALDKTGISGAMNALYLLALQAARSMAIALEFGYAEALYSRKIELVTDGLKNGFWDDERGLYADACDPGTKKRSSRFSQQTNALMILSGVVPADNRSALLSSIAKSEDTRVSPMLPLVIGDQDFDEDLHIVRANTYFAHFLYDALIKDGQMVQALDFMRSNLGPMLDAGAQTIWESYDPTASLCHAFSASPVYHLSAGVLGVRPTAPGFKTFEVLPHPGDLKWAKGAYPTPEGEVEVSWTLAGEEMQISVVAPPGLTGTLRAPTGWRFTAGGGEFDGISHASLEKIN